jgi:hypothetical protein
MGVSAAIANLLTVSMDVLDERGRFECAAVSKVRFDDDSIIQSECLKCVLCSDCLNRRETKLMLHMGEPCGMVIEETASFVRGRRSTTVGIKSPTKQSQFKVIHGDLTAWSQMIDFEGSKVSGICSGGGRRNRTTMTFRILANGTLDGSSVTLCSCSELRGQERHISQDALNGR